VRAILFALLLAACNQTTGSHLISFGAVAGGPADIGPNAQFLSGFGYEVVLSQADLHIGSIYLNNSVVASGSQETSCILPQADVYVGQAFGPLDLDLLSPTLVPFPVQGTGTETLAQTAQVWLNHGDIDDEDDTPTSTETTPPGLASDYILSVAGVAVKPGSATTQSISVPFTATVTIGENRQQPVQNPALPGSNPICEQRIVTPIAVDFTPTDGGVLTLRVDPRGMFNAVDFRLAVTTGAAPPYEIPDSPGGIGGALFSGLRANAGVYDFSFASRP
jgi:hypothetical protein